MTPEQFCYWMQGCAETMDDTPDKNQWNTIKNHLDTVFNKVTVKKTSTKRELLAEEIQKAETGKQLEDVMREMRRDSGIDPFDSMPRGRIC